MAKAWKTALTMKPMKNTQLADEYEHPAEMEKRLEMKSYLVLENLTKIEIEIFLSKNKKEKRTLKTSMIEKMTEID